MKPTLKSDFPEFFQAYLTAALWSTQISECDDDGPTEREGDPFDKHFSTSDFADEVLETLRAHAFSFWSRMWYYIDHEKGRAVSPAPSVAEAGHDFWLTSNGHGAGFWDGDWPVYGEQFTELAKCYPEINLTIETDPDTDTEKVGIM